MQPRRRYWQLALGLAILTVPALAWAAYFLGHAELALVLLSPPAIYGAIIAADVWTDPTGGRP